MQFTDIRFHKQLRSAWERMITRNRFPHTVLLNGKDGYGTTFLALELAERLLCKDASCREKIYSFNHPDLHFVYPTVTLPKAGAETSSPFFAEQWQGFLKEQPFGDFNDWMNYLNAGNKQGIIRVKDAENIVQTAYKYPLLGENKVFIIWHAEKMNTGTANKLLKVLEEPPGNTFFILTTDSPLQIIGTVRSRCVIFDVPPIRHEEMLPALQDKGIAPARAEQFIQAANGDWNKVLRFIADEDPFQRHKEYFVNWVRIAYLAKKKASAINDLKEWAEKMAAEPKNFQFDFLRFTLEIIRRSYLHHFNNEIRFFDFSAQSFDPLKFAPYVHSGNVEDFYHALTDSVYHLSRNAQPKPLFMDLSIRLTKLLHKKPLPVT